MHHPRGEAEAIAAFLDGQPHAVVGASSDRAKFGNKVLRCYLDNGRPAYAVNPRGGTIEGQHVYATLADLPMRPHGVSIVTPPAITRQVVDEALELGILHLWIQPGAEDDVAIVRAVAAGVNVIANGACVLVELGWRG